MRLPTAGHTGTGRNLIHNYSNINNYSYLTI